MNQFMGIHQLFKEALIFGRICGKLIVTYTGFYSSMGLFKDRNIANVLYVYDTSYGTNILLDHNNIIYMEDMMEYSLANPLLSEYNGIHIDIRLKNDYPNDSSSHKVPLSDVTIIPILYDGVLPYIPVWRPTPK